MSNNMPAPANIFNKSGNSSMNTGTTSNNHFANANFMSGGTKKGQIAEMQNQQARDTSGIPNAMPAPIGSSIFRNMGAQNASQPTPFIGNSNGIFNQQPNAQQNSTPFGSRTISISPHNNPGNFFSNGTGTNQLQNSNSLGIFNKTNTTQNSQSTGIFGRSPQNQQTSATNFFSQGGTTGLFSSGNQGMSANNFMGTSTNNNNTGIFRQGQGNTQGLPFGNQNQTISNTNFFNQTQNNNQNQNGLFPNNNQMFNPSFQPNAPLDANVQQYLRHFAQFLDAKDQMGFQNPMMALNQQNQMQGAQNQIPSQQAGNYHMFLGQAMSSDAMKKHSTPKQLFESAQNWANRVMVPPNHRLYAEKARQKQMEKLFDAKMLPYPFQMSNKQLPPIEPTLQMIQSMNDEDSCRMILCQLWIRSKKAFDQVLKMFPPQNSNSELCKKKLKQLPCFNQLAIMWKQIKNIENKVNQLSKQEADLAKTAERFNSKISEDCQTIKQKFVQINKDKKILDDIDEEFDGLSDYMDRQITPLFKAFVNEKTYPFQDPDIFVLTIATKLLNKIQNLETALDDQLIMITPQTEDSNQEDILLNLCKYYELIADQIYQADSKIKKYLNLCARRENHRNPDHFIQQIEKKTKQMLDKKMMAYKKIKQIERIIYERDPFAAKKAQEKQQQLKAEGAQDRMKPGMKVTDSTTFDFHQPRTNKRTRPSM